MLQHVNTVLIGTACPASYTNVDALTKGQVALFDQDMKLLADESASAKATSIYVGVCEGNETVYDVNGTAHNKAIIRYSMPIQKASRPHMVFSEYIAKSEDKIVITMTDVNIEVGHRYVLRLISGDLYEAPGQFAQNYEVIAKTTLASDIITELKNQINKSKDSRVVATSTDAVLTLVAKEIPYNEGIMIDTNYSQVSIDAFMWKTIPTGILSNIAYSISNLQIAKTQGTPGKGNPKIVRDRENAALGYRGITHRANGIYPYIAPELKADLNATYDSLVIEHENLYLSNDNQYIKNTPLTCELYVNAGSLKTSKFKTALDAFLA